VGKDKVVVDSAEALKESGFDIIGRTAEEQDDENSRVFDRLVGQAAICGTLNVARLLQFIRPYVVNQEVPDLDAFAHIILEL